MPDEMLERLQSRVGSHITEKYRLDALLGVGGMAAVYSATHRNGGRVALKVLHTELARISEIRTRFLREGYVANKIGHEGVVRIHDDEQSPDGKVVFLVMDLLEGRTLEQHRLDQGGQLAVPQAVRIVEDVLSILAAAHKERIIHRDIKPDNVFLTSSGATRLLDFGIARLLDSARMTGSGAVMGTPAFMSPEQAASQNKLVDAPSDVWSAGAVLFLLLTGEEVHRARTSAEQMIFAATQSARSVATVMPSLPAELAHVVDVALRFDIKDRWQSATAMGNVLRQVADEYGLRDMPRIATPGDVPSPPGAPPMQSPVSMPSSPTLIHGSGDPSRKS
jgi:serine/threonine-protein kinase